MMKKSAEDKNYIEVTQDGITRITSFTPNNIQGIYTEGLQTCIAIIIVGYQSVSIIHATNKLSVEFIKNELQQYDVQFWTIAYNPVFYPQKNEDEKLQQHLALYIEDIEAILPDKHLKIAGTPHMQIYEAKNGFVSVDRNGNIDVINRPKKIMNLPAKDKRNRINILNNFFSKYNETIIIGDLQFDGANFSDCSKLLIPLEDMIKLAKENHNPLNILGDLKSYMLAYGPQELGKSITEEEVETFKKHIDIRRIVTQLNQEHGWSRANNSEHKNENEKKERSEDSFTIPKATSNTIPKKLMVETIGTHNQKSDILSELQRITGNNWSCNTDGTMYWLTTSKNSVNQIMQHLAGKNTGKLKKNSPGTKIFIENAKLSSLRSVIALQESPFHKLGI